MKNQWGDMIVRLFNYIPTYVLDLMDGKERKSDNAWFTRVALALVIGFSATSLFSMDSIPGKFMAVVVPLAVMVSAHMWKTISPLSRVVAWAITIGSVLFSAFLQYGAYANGDYTLLTMFSATSSIRSLVLSFGVPLSEVSMAVLASIVADSTERSMTESKLKAEAERKAETERQAAEALREETTRIESEIRKAEAAAKIKAIEAEAEAIARQAKIDSDLEQERQRLAMAEKAKDGEAARQAKLIKAQAKAEKKPVSTPVATPVQTGKRPVSEVVDDRTLALAMIDDYHENGEVSDGALAKKNNVSRNRIMKVRNWLREQDVVHVESKGEGKGNIVTVNGKEQAFRNGEL